LDCQVETITFLVHLFYHLAHPPPPPSEVPSVACVNWPNNNERLYHPIKYVS
jgi:hypothetical protein